MFLLLATILGFILGTALKHYVRRRRDDLREERKRWKDMVKAMGGSFCESSEPYDDF